MPRRRPPAVRFEAIRILDLWSDDTSIRSIARQLGIERATIHRWKYKNIHISRWEADRLAIRAGVHPAEVWGSQWWLDEDDTVKA